MSDEPTINWDELLQRAGPYPIEAFQFVREGLAFTARQVHGQPSDPYEEDRHISPRQLCLGLRDYAIEKYGLLALTVFEHWHIHRTEDFGRIVFAMVDGGLMSKTDDDTIDDFHRVFDFRDVFTHERLLDRLHAKT